MSPRQQLAKEIESCVSFPIEAKDCKTDKEFLFATVTRAKLEGWYKDQTPDQWVDFYIQIVIREITAIRDNVRERMK